MNFIKTTSAIAIFCCFLVSHVQGQNKTSVLRSAKSIFIDAKSELMSTSAFERELLKLPEFEVWGLTITHNKEKADLIVEVYRKRWTTRFTIIVIDPGTKSVLASCEESSLGGEIEPKLANCLIKILRSAKAGAITEK